MKKIRCGTCGKTAGKVHKKKARTAYKKTAKKIIKGTRSTGPKRGRPHHIDE